MKRYYHIDLKLWDKQALANTVDPDQTKCAASDPGLQSANQPTDLRNISTGSVKDLVGPFVVRAIVVLFVAFLYSGFRSSLSPLLCFIKVFLTICVSISVCVCVCVWVGGGGECGERGEQFPIYGIVQMCVPNSPLFSALPGI